MSWLKNNPFILAALFIALLFSFSFLVDDHESNVRRGEMGLLTVPQGEVIELELAITPLQRAQGLSGRENLPVDRGMLFVFSESDYHHFWMQEMNFSIDIIWLDENFQVVHLEKNLAPESYPESFGPTKPALYVLELNANQTDILNISVDDFLNIAL